MKLGIVASLALCLSCVSIIHAQTTPAEREDAREERLKILRAADQIELIQSTSEKLRTDLDALKEQVTKLQDTNTALERELGTLRTALQKSEEARVKEREVLLSKIGEMIAASKTAEPKREKEKEPAPPSGNSSHDGERGYYHVVEKGQTLSLIASAYNEKGVKVTVDDIRKSNNLGSKDVLKIGQKLFIPKK